MLIQSVLSSCAWAAHDQTVDLEFRVVQGTRLQPVSAGTVWLFHYGWGRLDSLRLMEIHDEPIGMVLTPEWRDSLIPPEPHTDGCVVAIELPGPIWYPTADVSRADLLRDFEVLFWALGSRFEDPSGSATLILPEHPLRVLRLLDLEGNPVVGKKVEASIYLTDHNHCARHHGLRLGAFATDESGEVALRAPLVDLYLDDLHYFEDEGTGPWGRKFSGCHGLRLGSRPIEVIKKAWEFSQREVRITVVDGKGSPVVGVDLVQCGRSHECGIHCGSLWQTDARGVVAAAFAPESTESLTLRTGSGERPLTDAEIRELFEKGAVTIRLTAE